MMERGEIDGHLGPLSDMLAATGKKKLLEIDG